MPQQVSLIITVLNEGRAIGVLLESLVAQTQAPHEIVIVDGGSHDDTPSQIASYQNRLPIRLLSAPGCNISQGRNLAIAAASGQIIAATDAGVRIPPDWLANLIAPFDQTPPPMGVAGFFYPDPDPHNAFQVAMSATVLPLAEEINPKTFLPSSRSVAFQKSAWQQVGGYPEWLDYCEDLIFDLRLKKVLTADFVFAPTAVVFFKPRTTLGAFWRQYYLYARGDGKADLWRKRHAARYLTYSVLAPALLLLAVLLHPAFLLLLFFGGALYLRQPYRRLPRLWGALSPPKKLLAAGYVLVIRVVGDMAKMLGYPVGVLWRWQQNPPDWQEL